ncbi:MAG: glutamate synthase large subunit [Candidatus Alcyoniella australis]|nr:glutamate synthase large subunit [Candidatus Alcyoniella australis]
MTESERIEQLRRTIYDPRDERDACGVGFVVRLDNDARHEVVEQGIQALVNLEHRGAVGGDSATGDGAGLLFKLPDRFLRTAVRQLGFVLPPLGDYGLGMIFAPQDRSTADKCIAALENAADLRGCRVLGRREVPTDLSCLGEDARRTCPRIVQLFLERGSIDPADFERELYIVRRLAEKQIESQNDAGMDGFYVASLSCRTVVYKGLLTASQLPQFYRDLSDPELVSPYVLIHQRYSTNTLPTWALAQPFRYSAHNGEINTLRGNINQQRAREGSLSSKLFGDDLRHVLPALDERGSDSSIFDNMLELLVRTGRNIPHAMMMMIPEAWGPRYIMSADKRAFYEYHSAILEPWDGPAALMFCDDRYIGATLDRNGLRPARYTITSDGLVVMASETGVLDIEPERIARRGQLQPGRMFLIDLQQKRVIPDHEIKSKVSRAKPYRHWLNKNIVELKRLFQPASAPRVSEERMRMLHQAFGYSSEELKLVLNPMASWAQEPVGSMGNDTALSVLADRPQLLFNYFKQLFAQVTNPPIDPLREELVMSLLGWVGGHGNLLEETAEQCRRLKLFHPILTPDDLNLLRMGRMNNLRTADIDMLFNVDDDPNALEQGLERMFADALAAIEDGADLLVLSDWNLNRNKAAIPSLLALAGLHHELIRRGLRNRVSLIVETAEAREVGHFALLVGYGANAVCPYAAMLTITSLVLGGRLERPGLDSDHAVDHYITALKKGLLKTFSRMGISTLRSYCGAQIFEAVGLDQGLIERYFTGTSSRIGGIGLDQIAREALARHQRAFPDNGRTQRLLDCGGNYRYRVGGERHLWTPEAIYKLQHAVRSDDYAVYKQYAELINDQSQGRATLRSMFEFKPGEAVPLDQVEPVESIVKRFVSAAMSFGSLSREAHEALAVAMNRLGGRSNSGEGGEDPARYTPLPNGDSKCSRIKQIASGRFGVTTEYLLNAEELQIKIAQGAKPGEGGQLPGHKVSDEIARVRHTTPGVTLISPPPHHDIYSIEDLAQLIYDLKCVKPGVRVSVKLVSEIGVGTVASGVAKAQADGVLISGSDGGTGASPLTAIMHAGAPWELGLAETQHSLVYNRLRDKVRVQVDGQLKTGRDCVIAALMGAEEFGFGTTALVCLGCVMMRKCHTDTCPVGVATQNPELRGRFAGKPEYVEHFLRFIAQDMRELMSELGFRSVDEMVGRSDHLSFAPALEHHKARGLDLSALLIPAHSDVGTPLRCTSLEPRVATCDFDNDLIASAQPALRSRERVAIEREVRNVHRAVGARLSGELVRLHGPSGLEDGTIDITLNGSAGQSLGAFLAPGINLRVHGDANDYMAKGMSGGRIVLTPHNKTRFRPHENVIVGNVVLYGATGGEVFIAGRSGIRFAVRNSGARAVVEGMSDHGCEYMTGGTVVVLGSTGWNFAAGMSGGVAYVYDENQLFDTRCNLDMVELETVWAGEDVDVLRSMIENHLRYTNSPRAREMLDNWEDRLPLFVKVIPLDYKRAIERIRIDQDFADDSLSATEEVYDA